MNLCVVGLGLMGGSFALDLKACGFVGEVIGVDENPDHQKEAIALKLVDRIESLQQGCRSANLVILAAPVNAILSMLPTVLDFVSDDAVVTDVGSTKKRICESIRLHKKKQSFVASHPMAGTEFSGPTAALRGLFRGKAAVICDADESNPKNVETIKQMYQKLGMKIIFMNSSDHDLHAAYVSHLSHISSIVLANTVLDKENDEEAIFNLASGGFESTVRLAKSSPETWTPIFEHNQEHLAEALGAYIDRLKNFQTAITHRDFPQIKKYIEHANEIKRVLLSINR